jgi:hypothetical protein
MLNNKEACSVNMDESSWNMYGCRRRFENDQIKSGYERGIGKILCTQNYQRTRPYRLQPKATTEGV